MTTTIADEVPALLSLPTEVFFAICRYLDIAHIVAFSETCRAGYQLMHDRTIWLHIFQSYQRRLPLPKLLRGPLLEFNLSDKDLKSIVLSIHHASVAWFQPRNATCIPTTGRAGLVVGLELFLDRWLLSIHAEGQVLLWDISSVTEAIPAPIRLLNLEARGVCHVAIFDKAMHSIILVMSVSHGSTFTRIYRIPLPVSRELPAGPAEFIRGIETGVSHKPKLVDLSNCFVAFSRPGTIDVVHWGGDGSQTTLSAVDMDMVSLSTESTPLEDLIDTIHAVRVAGPYFISFRTRCIEIYPLRLRKSDPQHLLYKQPFSLSAFRDILLSDIEFTHSKAHEPFDGTISFSFMGYDVLEGLFHFEVSIQAASDYSVSPVVDLTLVGIYPLTHSINAITPPLAAYRSIVSSSNSSSSTPTPTQVRSGSSRGDITARGFINTYALGSQGRRAVWVERSRRSTTRDFVVWGKQISNDEDNDTIEIEKTVVHAITSQDMRDDVACCTLGESSGRIAYANRAGDIFVIPPSKAWLCLERLCNYLAHAKDVS